jgi:hypothetical protein
MVEGALVGEFETLTRTTTKLRASSVGTGARAGNRTSQLSLLLSDLIACMLGVRRDEGPAQASPAGV